MINADTELLFPLRLVNSLSGLRGSLWDELVGQISQPEVEFADQIAFVNFMVKMDGCVNCNSDSFRAMRGCAQCARQTIRRFRGTDEELIDQFLQSKKEVEAYLLKRSMVAK